MPLAHSGTVLSLLDGPVGCDPGFGIVWNGFRVMRRFLACRPVLIGSVFGGALGHGCGVLLGWVFIGMH